MISIPTHKSLSTPTFPNALIAEVCYTYTCSICHSCPLRQSERCKRTRASPRYGQHQMLTITINGKSSLFSRPALVIKKLSRSFFLVAPTTSMPHAGSWYVQIKHAGRATFICLHQIRTIDYRRLSSRIGQVDDEIKRLYNEGR